MDLQSLATREEVADAAAEFIRAQAQQAISVRNRFSLALSGGSTPWRMLDKLTQYDLPWDKIDVLQVDERVAPDADTDRNLTHIRRRFTDRVAILPDRVHAMPVWLDNLDDAAYRYEKLLSEICGTPPVIDLIHLGLGIDGHTASLLPGDPVLNSVDRDVDIARTGDKRIRMTLTYPIINRARHILWFVTGREKAATLTRLIQRDDAIPAGRISQDQAVIITDIALASPISINARESSFNA